VAKPAVTVWVGNPGKSRGPSATEPAPVAGDSDAQTVELAYDGKGRAGGDVVLPPLPPGKVYWYRPSYVNGAGKKFWVSATTFVPAPAVDREPAALVLRHEAGQRSMELKSKMTLKMFPPEGVNAKPRSLLVNMETRLTEQTQAASPQGLATVTLNYRRYGLGLSIDGKPAPKNPRIQKIVDSIKFLSARLVVDGQGNIKANQVDLSRVPRLAREDLADLHSQIGESIEAIAVPVPNREVRPGETWQSLRKLPIVVGSAVERAVLAMNFTYRGTVVLKGRKAALIDITGQVRGGQGRELRVSGRATGQAAFDLERGQVANANLTVALDLDITEDGERSRATGTLETRLARDFSPPVDLASAREVLRVNGELTPTDPTDRVRKESYHKAYPLEMAAGRTYVIDMKARGGKLDSYLRLEDPDGKEVANDDDSGGGLDARIVYRAARAGAHKVICTTYKGMETGPYVLTVLEAGPAKEKPPDVVKGPPKDDPKVVDPKGGPGVRPGKEAFAGPARVVDGAQVSDLTLPAKGLVNCLCWSADGKAFYTLHAEPGVLRRVAFPGMQEELVLEVGAKANWLALSAEGLVLSVTGRQEVWLVDPATLQVKKRLPLPGLLQAVSAPPLSVAIAAVGDNPRTLPETLAVLDLKTGATAKVYGRRDFDPRQGLAFGSPTVTPDGVYLFTRSDRLHRFRIAGGALALEETCRGEGLNPVSIAVSPDSKWVCMPSGGGNGLGGPGAQKLPRYHTVIYAVKALGVPAVVIAQGAYPRTAAFDPRTGKIYAQNMERQLLVFNAQGKREREMALGGRGEDTAQILPHPEGGRLLVLTSARLCSVQFGP
jgi:hypothetical protein